MARYAETLKNRVVAKLLPPYATIRHGEDMLQGLHDQGSAPLEVPCLTLLRQLLCFSHLLGCLLALTPN